MKAIVSQLVSIMVVLQLMIGNETMQNYSNAPASAFANTSFRREAYSSLKICPSFILIILDAKPASYEEWVTITIVEPSL